MKEGKKMKIHKKEEGRYRKKERADTEIKRGEKWCMRRRKNKNFPAKPTNEKHTNGE